jgi:hypothetical protein
MDNSDDKGTEGRNSTNTVINGEVKNYQNVKKHDKHTEEEMWGA